MPLVILGVLLFLAALYCIYHINRNIGGAIKEHKLDSLDIKKEENDLDEKIHLKEEELKSPSEESDTK